MMWRWGQGGYATWMGWLGPVFMLVFLALAVAGIVALVRYSAGRDRSGGAESALELLKKRYARGEISKEEFEEKRNVLGE